MILTWFLIEEIPQETSQDRLVTHYQEIVLSLQLQQDWPYPLHDIHIGFPPRVSVPQFILVAPRELLRELVLHFLIAVTLAHSLE